MSTTLTKRSASLPLDYPDYMRLLAGLNIRNSPMTISSCSSVKEVLDWMQRQGTVGSNGVDMVGQDEFEYDFLIRLGQDDRWCWYLA